MYDNNEKTYLCWSKHPSKTVHFVEEGRFEDIDRKAAELQESAEINSYMRWMALPARSYRRDGDTIVKKES